MKVRLLNVVCLCCLLLASCNSQDDVSNGLGQIETNVSNLQSAMSALQKAYDDGKNVKSITPLGEKVGGWEILFSDNTLIRLQNGQDGRDTEAGIDEEDDADDTDNVTPYLFVDQDGYWCISYDNSQNFTHLMNNDGDYIKAQGEKGDKGDEGMSIRVTIDADDFYIYELYKLSDPTNVIETIDTPYNTNPSHLIYGIMEDDVAHTMSLTMQNGKTYTFDKVYNTPTSIAILTNRILIGDGTTQAFEFRVNPSNATFNYDVTSDDCEIELDLVGQTRSADSYVTVPTNYKLTKVEQVYTEAGALKTGQYRAYITDQNLSNDYDDQVTLVLTVTNDNGEKIQLSSSSMQIKYSSSLFTEFKFLKAENDKVLEDVECIIDGSNITLSTPFILDKTKLVANYKTNGKKVFVGSDEQENGVTINDFSTPVKYTVVSEDGEKNVYTVTVKNSELPVVYIDTKDGAAIVSKEDWLKKTAIKIIKEDGSIDYEDNSLQIRGRGNTTWRMPKKPYALKLDSKHEILGMPEHKRWVLLANWQDRTLLRNDVAFQISKQTCMDWTPRGKFVEVVLNGKHIGNYYLCEQIKVGANRVNITEMEETDIAGDEVTGGYLVELDNHYDEVNQFMSATKNLPYLFKDPDEDVMQPEQFSYFQKYINKLEKMMYADDWLTKRKYAKHMDLNTFADWWFVHELAHNREPNGPRSCYMHKDRLGVLKAGPVWDFDRNTFVPVTSFAVKKAIYYERLFQDPAFVKIVKKRWKVVKPQFDQIADYIRTTAAKTRVSNEINIGLWPIYTTHNGDETMSFDESIDRMVSAYETRLAMLDRKIKSW